MAETIQPEQKYKEETDRSEKADQGKGNPEQSKGQPVPATHYAITPELRTVLLDYLNNKPRKEVNNMCIVLEQAAPITIAE